MPKVKLEVRQSHSITNLAVGALHQIGGLSLAPFDIRYWEEDGIEIEMPRLQAVLYRTFRKAPVREQRGEIEVGGRIPVARFPRWMYCPKCRQMFYDPHVKGHPDATIFCKKKECQESRSTLSPMPWVMICANGHLDDLPWHGLVHSSAVKQNQKTCQCSDKMFFNPPGRPSRGSQVVCMECKASLNLNALRAPEFIGAFPCSGRQPWLYSEEKCTAKPEAAGLGDHFVHYPAIISALDIPPESRRNPRDNIAQRLRQHPDWRRLHELYSRHGASNPVVEQMISAMANTQNCTNKQIQQFLVPGNVQTQPPEEPGLPLAEPQALRADEYKALLAKIDDYMEYERFITIHRTMEWHRWIEHSNLPKTSRMLMKQVRDLVGVTRLREVRALRGFTRVHPPGSEGARLVPPDLIGETPWLPAAEFFGEGVFFTLNHSALFKWQQRVPVLERTKMIREGFEAHWPKRIEVSESAIPAFVMLHTLAHLMIREMAFECGYPAASLRERLYFGEAPARMAGILIYLAASEPGGSLGGLAQLSEPPRFAGLLERALETAKWCALDPVCAEHEGRGSHRLNRAACHACCLLPETSCECSNLMMDRRLVVADEGTGFFDYAG